MTEKQGMYTVPTRLFLSLEHRRRLEQLVRAEKCDLADIVSQIVADYLDHQPELPQQLAPQPDYAAELRQRQSELNRLRARRDTAGRSAPAWLGAYIAELEAEVHRLRMLLAEVD